MKRDTVFRLSSHYVRRDVLKHIFDAFSKDPNMQYVMIDGRVTKIDCRGRGAKGNSKRGHRPTERRCDDQAPGVSEASAFRPDLNRCSANAMTRRALPH